VYVCSYFTPEKLPCDQQVHLYIQYLYNSISKDKIKSGCKKQPNNTSPSMIIVAGINRDDADMGGLHPE
ncbi:hypothetical protein Q4595_19685, partial [Wenyingzhuangia sp. 1_MG-2023]|nr:hypothetical protein [Wenyingzhuangia sp. 1_MG-2023]